MVMLSQKEYEKVYEVVVLRSPWMDEVVKIDLRIKRKDILLLSQIIERGMTSQEANRLFSDGAAQGVITTVSELLEKGKLTEFSEGLKDLAGSKA